MDKKKLFYELTFFSELSEIAYAKHPTIDKIDQDTAYKRFKDLKIEVIDFIENTRFDVQCYILQYNNMVIVDFRGSDSDRDWGVNRSSAKIQPIETKYSEGQVHFGFYTAVSSIIDRIYGTLSTLDLSEKKLCFTGHSLGGGSTTTLLYIWDNKKYPISAWYTYGQPRTMDYKAKEYFNKKYLHTQGWRVVNSSDAVPQVPLTKLFGFIPLDFISYFGWHHVGTEVYLTHKGKVLIGNNTNRFLKFIDKIYSAIGMKFSKKVSLIENHHPCFYHNKLAKLAGKEKRLKKWIKYSD
jgi:hypothetical protein